MALGAGRESRITRGQLGLVAAALLLLVGPFLLVVSDSPLARLALVAVVVWFPVAYLVMTISSRRAPVSQSAPAPESAPASTRDDSDGEEAKTLFLAAASHELKTPLTVIRGFSQMLVLPDNRMTDEERATALRAIDLRARQLTGIVDRILLSSRIESGRIDLTPERVDIVPILEQLAASAEASTSRDVTLHIEPALPELWVDPQAFTTVVDHLLDNAIKYSPAGGPVTLEASTVGDHVELVFTDEGVGMTVEHAAKCFDRFWQAELSDVRRFGGTGIGLYIVRSLVEAMDGHISVTSSPGEGSTFTVALTSAAMQQSSWELKELHR